MKKRDGIIKFILKPPMWLCIVVWTVGALSLAGTLTLYYIGLGLALWAWAVHAVALVFLLLSIYAVLTVIGIPERVKDKPRVKQFFRAIIRADSSMRFVRRCSTLHTLYSA